MKGPRELKRYVSIRRAALKAAHFDGLLIFKLERCDGYGLHRQEALGA